jgi:hypothetical protein
MTRTTRTGLGAIILAATSAAALGCGGSNDADKFIGTWKVTQASAQVSCSDGTSGTFTPTGNVEFAPGTTTALVAVSPSELDSISPCDFTFSVSGATATMTTGQTCNLIGFSAGTVKSTFSPGNWQFSLTGANSAEEVGTAMMVLPGVDPTTGQLTGMAVTCMYTAHMATLARIAKD